MEDGARGFAFGRPVDQNVLLAGRQVFKRELQVDFVAISCQVDELEEILRGGAGPEAAIEQRL